MSPERPLKGKRVVITRPRAQAEAFSRLLRASGAEVVELPTIEIVEPSDWSPVDVALQHLSSYRIAIFTSANGVARFLGRMRQRGHASEELRDLQLVAIGPATADALTSCGLDVDIVPEEYRAEGVVEVVARAAGGRLDGIRVLLPRALKAREVLPEGLRALGAEVDVVPVYRTTLPAGGRERAATVFRERVDVITFTSSSTVQNFLRLMGPEETGRMLHGVAVACIGPITAETAQANGLEVSILPGEYTVEALHHALERYFRTG
jgi:uroporphyrinogen III methyltransferase/synthase